MVWIFNYGNITIKNSIFNNNTSINGTVNYNMRNMITNTSTFINNTAMNAAAINNINTSLFIQNASFIDNYADNQTVIVGFSIYNNTFSMTNSTIMNDYGNNTVLSNIQIRSPIINTEFNNNTCKLHI